MKGNNVSRILAAAFAVALVACPPMAACADEWFVSPSGNDSAAGTETAPFRTLTNAVARASANDIVTLLPGDHVEGFATTTVSGNSSKSRVVIDKKLTIRSKNGRASRDTTRIVGAWDTDVIANTPYGFGPNAVRCVWIDTDGSGTKLEGITFVNGSVPAYSSSNDYTAGGGVLVYGNANTATIVDCAFIDCQAWNGGGLCYPDTKNKVKAVRCLFRGCRSSKFGHAMRGGAAYNCIFDDNGRTCEKNGTIRTDSAAYDSGAMAYFNVAVNCTFINNDSYGIGGYGTVGKAYNCLFMNNGAGSINTKYEKTFANCVNHSSLTTNNSVSVAFTDSSEVYSPYDGDYRLVAGARSLTAGNASFLANTEIIPAEYSDTDFYGNQRTTDGVVYCGAVQDVADATASGVAVAYTTEGDWYLDGEKLEIRSRTWKAVEGWPKPRHVKFVPVNGKALVRFSFGGGTVWPLRDDSAWFTTSRAGQVQTVSATTTSNIFYADPVNGSDETGDGSESNPYKTLNKAVHKTTANFVVRAKAGDYNEGGEHYAGITNRVVVPDTLAGILRVVAVDGPEATFITGALATSGDTANGTGPDAVRCIAVASTNKYHAAFQGFTIRDGRTDGAISSDAGVKTYGGGMLNIKPDNTDLGTGYLLDCVVTNCSGRRGGCISGGAAFRCQFIDCNSYNGGGGCVMRYCSVASSLFKNCGKNSQVFGPTAKGYNCTLYGSTFDSVYTGSYGTGYMYNCVAGGRSGTYADIGEAATDNMVRYTLYSRLSTSSTETFTTAEKENPLLLVDAANGDYRLATDSAGLYLAVTDHMKSCMDIDGNPFDFADGRYQAGCYAARKGVTIFVDAVNGNDANDGSSESSAFATLAAAMAAADYGDTVVALPGTYDSGTMLQTLAQSGGDAEPTLRSRVVVKNGVTLASRDGAAATTIRGEASSDGAAVSGCGVGAVRGAFLCKGATLRGFTVTGGHTLYGSTSSMTVNDYGGAVGGYYGASATTEEFTALVEDCIIAGNVACRGAGGMFGTYRNCLFSGNTLVMDKPGWAVARAHLEGCFFSGNGSSGNHSAIYGCDVVNCTVLGGQAGNNGVICNESAYQNKRAVLNTIVTTGKIKVNVCTNCLFGSGVSNMCDSPLASGIIVGDAKLDANGIPLDDSPAIDAGDNALASTELLAGRDPAGTRRVLNGTIDIGAYEYDWGVPWGRTIGGKKLVVYDMPSDAVLSNGKLVFSDGAVLMTWAKGQVEARYSCIVRVTGNGSLSVMVNGETVGTYTSADGAQEIRFESDLATNALEFGYTPGDGDTGGAELYGFTHSNGLVISFR